MDKIMTQNIEQRTLAAVNQYENASGTIDKFAHADEVVNTPAGTVKTFPKISKEWDENSKALTADWKAERDALSIKALPVLAWANGETETNINQQRRFTDGHTYLPKAAPALMNAEPDSNWIAYTADKSDVLSDVFGSKPVDLVNGMTITPIQGQYPKLAAFNAIYELADNSVAYTVKSFAQSVGLDCVITLSDDSLLIAKKVESASRSYVHQSSSKAQNQIIGNIIFPENLELSAKINDYIATEIEFIRVDGSVYALEKAIVKAGTISALSTQQITINADVYDLYPDLYNTPSSVFSAKNRTYKIGTVITTASHYSPSECSTFEIEYPDRGGARYLVVADTNQIEDTVKYHRSQKGFVLELLDPPNSRNAGMVANYKSASEVGFDNLAKSLALDSLNKILQNNNRFHGGKFYVSAPDLVLSCDSKGEGKYVTQFYVEPASTAKSCCTVKRGVIARDIAFYSARTNQTKTFIANPWSQLFVPSFDYHDRLYGAALESETAVVDIACRAMDRGLRGTAGTKNVTVVRGDFWGGNWGASFYDVELLSFDGSKIYGGNIGGLGMPSCKHVSVGGGTIVYNPNGTGINTGGSSANGYNAEDINIGRCTVYARDCINLENGCVSAVINGYKIFVISELPQNGVGIGVYSRADNNGGHVGDISIGAGQIQGIGGVGRYSHAVKVGYFGNSNNAMPIRNITIAGVKSTGSRVGIESIAPTNSSATDVNIDGCNCQVSQTGVALTGEHQDSSVGGGSYTSANNKTLSGTYAVRFGLIRRVTFDGIKTKGFPFHYRQDGIAQDSVIKNPTALKGVDNANFQLLENTSGSGNIQILQMS